MPLIQNSKNVYLTFKETAVPANPDSGDQRIYVDPADHKLKLVNSSGTVSSIGGSASNPYVVGQGTVSDLGSKIQIPQLSSHADISGGPPTGGLDYEFDSATDPFTWSTNPGAFDSNSTFKSHYYLSDAAGSAKYGLISWSPAGAFDARAKLLVGADHGETAQYSFGFWVGSSDNNTALMISVEGGFAVESTLLYSQAVLAYTISGGAFTQRGKGHLTGNTTYARFSRDGSNNVSFYLSDNGLIWRKIATQAHTVSVAKIGLRINSVSAVSMYGAIDWIRTNV